MIPGKIRIKDKVYFEYYELEKPDVVAFEQAMNYHFVSEYYQNIIKEYEASKRLIEVSNVFWSDLSKEWLFGRKMKGSWSDGPKNNQPCKAEINGKTCTIVELIKE